MTFDCRLEFSTVELRSFYASCVMGSPSAFQALSTRRTSMILDCRLRFSTVELKSFYGSYVMGSSSALQALSTRRTKETIVRRGSGNRYRMFRETSYLYAG